MTDTLTDAEVTPEAIGAVMGQLMGDFAASAGTFLGFLGARVGLWDALAAGPGSAEVVAERAGLGAAYVREWLRSQAAAGYVGFDPRNGAFSVSPAVAAVFASGALSGLPVGLASQFRVYWTELERYEEAFRSGRGDRVG